MKSRLLSDIFAIFAVAGAVYGVMYITGSNARIASLTVEDCSLPDQLSKLVTTDATSKAYGVRNRTNYWGAPLADWNH